MKGLIVFLIIGFIGGLAAFALRPTKAPSEDISAVPVEDSLADMTDEELDEALALLEETKEDLAEAKKELSNDGETEKASENAPASMRATYTISQAESVTRFYIDEVLNGKDKTVIGETSQVAGELSFDPFDVQGTNLGEIRINARTLKTDSSSRDNAIKRFILKTEEDANEYITFVPTNLSGLPKTLTGGTSADISISGNLTVSGVTKPATFSGNVLYHENQNLVGDFTATINYNDFNLTIPEVPFVASVEDNVKLTIDFIAKKK